MVVWLGLLLLEFSHIRLCVQPRQAFRVDLLIALLLVLKLLGFQFVLAGVALMTIRELGDKFGQSLLTPCRSCLLTVEAILAG